MTGQLCRLDLRIQRRQRLVTQKFSFKKLPSEERVEELTGIAVRRSNRGRLVYTSSEQIGHDIAALTVTKKNNTAGRAALVDVGLDLAHGVVDAIRDRVGITSAAKDAGRVLDCDTGRVGDGSCDQVGDLRGLALTRRLVGSPRGDHV